MSISPEKAQYARDEQVTLTATADDGLAFGGWEGIYESENPVTISVKRNLTIGARFVTEGELVRNGSFDASTQDWSLGQYDGASATFGAVDGNGVITIANGGSENWSVQLLQTGLPLDASKEYVLSFEAKATNPVTIMVGVGEDGGEYKKYGSDDISLTTQMQSFAITVAPTTADPNARIEFNMGAADGTTITLDNVSLRVKSTTPVTHSQSSRIGASSPVQAWCMRQGSRTTLFLRTSGSDVYSVEGFLPSGRRIFRRTLSPGAGLLRIPMAVASANALALRVTAKAGEQEVVQVRLR
jgi:hypothetical protein